MNTLVRLICPAEVHRLFSSFMDGLNYLKHDGFQEVILNCIKQAPGWESSFLHPVFGCLSMHDGFQDLS